MIAGALALPGFAADPPLVSGVSGAPVAWSDFVARRGPLVVLVWASWAPSAKEVLGRRAEMVETSRERGLSLVFLDVQESLEDAREALGSTQLDWIHDRHGALLKTYRVIRVPSVVVVSKQGEALAWLEPTPDALREWRPR